MGKSSGNSSNKANSGASIQPKVESKSVLKTTQIKGGQQSPPPPPTAEKGKK